MQVLLQDLAYGVRMMRRAPAFTAAIIVTLALGIGVNAATFSIVNVLMLKPLTYKNPDRVAFVLGWSTARQQQLFNLPLADAIDIAKAGSFQDVAEYAIMLAVILAIAMGTIRLIGASAGTVFSSVASAVQ